MTGKTQTAKRLVSNTRLNCLVYDPTAPRTGWGQPGWDGAFTCNEFEPFEAAFWKSRGCLVVIDEAADVFRDYRSRARPMLTRGRHVIDGGGGHVCMILAQRHRDLDKSARDQCSALFAFQVDRDDSEDLANDWNCDALRGLYKLPPLHYVHLVRHGQPTRGVLTF